MYLQADLTNIELAEKVSLSTSACFRRVKALKEASYFRASHADVDLEQLCEYVFAYIEFTSDNNSVAMRRKFADVIKDMPHIMDCMQLSGDVDYISFSCFPDIKALNEACTALSDNPNLSFNLLKHA